MESHWSHTPFVLSASIMLIGVWEGLLMSLGELSYFTHRASADMAQKCKVGDFCPQSMTSLPFSGSCHLGSTLISQLPILVPRNTFSYMAH